MLLHLLLWGAVLAWTGLGLLLLRDLRADRPLAVPAPPREAWPPVTVALPARNEAGRPLRDALESLLALDYPDLEILAFDDRSTDATFEILEEYARRDPRVQVTRVLELPAGWLGRSHAFHQAVERGRGKWLLTVDADTLLHPGTLKALVSRAEGEDLALVSVVPGWWTGTLVERLWVPFDLTCTRLSHPRVLVRSPRSPHAVAHGGCMLVRLAAARAAGGYRSFRDNTSDDQSLAYLLKRHGGRIDQCPGGDLYPARYYAGPHRILPTEARRMYSYLAFAHDAVLRSDLLRGLLDRRMLGIGRGHLPLLVALGGVATALGVAGLTVAPTLLALAGVFLDPRPSWWLPAALAAGLQAAVHGMVTRAHRLPSWTALPCAFVWAAILVLLARTSLRFARGDQSDAHGWSTGSGV